MTVSNLTIRGATTRKYRASEFLLATAVPLTCSRIFLLLHYVSRMILNFDSSLVVQVEAAQHLYWLTIIPNAFSTADFVSLYRRRVRCDLTVNRV